MVSNLVSPSSTLTSLSVCTLPLRDHRLLVVNLELVLARLQFGGAHHGRLEQIHGVGARAGYRPDRPPGKKAELSSSSFWFPLDSLSYWPRLWRRGLRRRTLLESLTYSVGKILLTVNDTNENAKRSARSQAASERNLLRAFQRGLANVGSASPKPFSHSKSRSRRNHVICRLA